MLPVTPWYNAERKQITKSAPLLYNEEDHSARLEIGARGGMSARGMSTTCGLSILITVWVDVCTCRPSVISTSRGDCRLRLVLVASVCASWPANCCAGLMRWTEIGLMISSESASTNDTKLSILVVGCLGGLGTSVALEPASAASGCVVV